jgi:hypothetical protein
MACKPLKTHFLFEWPGLLADRTCQRDVSSRPQIHRTRLLPARVGRPLLETLRIVSRPMLFKPQGDQRIDLGGAAGGDVASQHGHSHQDEGDDEVRYGI